MENIIKTFDGKEWDKSALIEKMYDDSFYYGYLGKNALSSSSIKDVLRSPKTYQSKLKYSNDNGNHQALRDGRLFHLAVLEPHKFAALNVVEVASKASKKYKDAVVELGEVYTRSEIDSARYLADAMMSNHTVQNMLEGAEYEIPMAAMIDGLAFRAKADVLNGNTIIDLKTTTGIEKFKWSAKNYSYDLQAHLYREMFPEVEHFVFITIDKATKEMGIYECSENFYAEGKKKLDAGIASYKHFFKARIEDPMQYILHQVL
jgi:hypothetical protein